VSKRGVFGRLWVEGAFRVLKREQDMKVMLLAYEAPEDFALRENKAKYDDYMKGWMAFGQSMRAAGVYVDSAALHDPGSATVVAVRNGKRSVEDGPYSDTKEQLGGFCIIEVPDLKAATQWAVKCPAAKRGFVDVRPVPYLDGGPIT
jgi:hypothetical protein